MFFSQRTPPPPANVQVQCPKCGAQNASVQTEWQDPITRKPIKSNGGLDPLYATAIILVSAALSFFLTGSFLGPDRDCFALVLTAVVSIGIISAYGLRAAQQQARAIRVHNYECQYCRHRWSWQEGTPIPRYNRKREIEQDYQEVFGHAPEDSEGLRTED